MAAGVDSATQTWETAGNEEGEVLETATMGSPRVVIDTSPPFDTVEEAVLRFGGRGFWTHDHLALFRAPAHQGHDYEKPDIYNLEERATTMLNDLHMKEQETLEMLKELEMNKQLVEELKQKLTKETPKYMPIPCSEFDVLMSKLDKECLKKNPTDSTYNHATKSEEQSNSLPTSPAELIMMELKHAKLNLYHNTNEIAAIRASVESLGKKMEGKKSSVERAQGINISGNLNEVRASMPAVTSVTKTLAGSVNPLRISRELQELNYEAEQFMKTAEAARLEVLKAMSDIEQTKTGLKVIEMGWVTAKKLEEAARAVESLALAEIRALSSNDNATSESYQQNPGRISLSLEEYTALTNKAQKTESLFWREDMDDPFRKIEEATEKKLRKMPLEEVFNRVEAMNRSEVSADDALRRFMPDPTPKKPAVETHSDFRNSFQSRHRRDSILLEPHKFELVKNERTPVLRPASSIGNKMSTKLVLRDDLDVGRQGEGGGVGRERVSLNQMLHQQRGETSPLHMREKNGGGSKKFFSKRKALGLVHISLPLSKPRKNKI